MTELTRTYKLTNSGAWGWVTEEAEGNGGGGITFADVLADLAALGDEIDPTNGAMLFAPTVQNAALMRLKYPPGYFDSGYYQPFEIVNENDFVVFTVSAAGDIDVVAPAGSSAGWGIRSTDFPFNHLDMSAVRFTLQKVSDSTPFGTFGLVDGAGVQTGDVLRIDSRARLEMGNVSGAPADGEITNGRVHFWPDMANGAAVLRGKGKTLDGTVVTFAIPAT